MNGRRGWQFEPRRFNRIVIDYEIDRRQTVTTGQPVEGEVFDPDARVKQFGLMAGHYDV